MTAEHMRKNSFFMKVSILCFMLPLLVSGCGKRAPQPQPQAQQQAQGGQEADKVPDQLRSMEGSIEQILQTLNGPSAMQDKSPGTQPQGAGQQSQQKGKEGGQEGAKKGGDKEGGDKEGGGKEGGDKETVSQQGGSPAQPAQQAQAPTPQEPWDTLSPIINNLHYQWNAYMPLAMKKGANKQLVDNFSTALNSLTNTIIGKNKTNTLLAASYLYAYIPDFYTLYRTESSPEIKRVRHYIRNAMLNAMTANWVQAETDLNNLKSTWTLYKNAVPKDQQENAGKLDYSIYELEKVIKEKNQPLIDIKGRVALSNVQAMDKTSGQGGK
ncbi:MAG: hypothetical protein N2484_01760 [Clostridia bacterium]|nr:hypothetical protein [Clostridia bacterium]